MTRINLGAREPQTVSKRLVLTAVEVAALTEAAGLDLPPGFGPDPSAPSDEQLAEARARLAERGVLRAGSEGGYDVVPAVLAQLAVLAYPTVSVSIEGNRGEGALKAWYAVRDGLGASAFVLPEGARELSVFAATALGAELIRAVPDLAAAEPIPRLNLGAEVPPPVDLSGRYPLAALAASGLDYDALQGVPAQVKGARVLLDGSLRILTLGRDQEGVTGTPVLWFSAGTQWYAAQPVVPSASELQAGWDRVIELHPVRRDEIGAWVAPGVATALDAAAAAPHRGGQ